MAERIVSPGVFTQEIDRTFLPTGIAEIGAGIVGPTQMGPAFVPTEVTSPNDFILKFGDSDGKSYVPIAAKQYLQNSTSATILRILGFDGYDHNNVISLIVSGTISGSGALFNETIGILHKTNYYYDSGTFQYSYISGSGGTGSIDVLNQTFTLKISGSYGTSGQISQ